MANSQGGINNKAREALNCLAIRAIAAAQAVNGNPQADPARISRALDAIEARVGEARQELEKPEAR